MNVPELFYRIAELSSESVLAQLILGNRVRLCAEQGCRWLTVGEREGRLVLLDDEGRDYSFSDLSVIEEVEWVGPQEGEGPAPEPPESDGISPAALDAVR